MKESFTKAVFDCNVFAQALINPSGPAADCLRRAQSGDIQLYVSAFVLLELWELPSKIPPRFGVTFQRAERFIFELGRYTIPVTAVPQVFSYSRDPDDAHYVNLALAASAAYLVSRDKDLLALMDRTIQIGSEFGFRWPGLAIIDPLEFIRICRNRR